MIVVVGSLAWTTTPSPSPAGRACGIALAAARRGARVELVGRVGEDEAGERLLLALAGVGVGHAAVLRDPARGTPILTPPEASPDEDASLLADDAPALAQAVARPQLEGADVDLAIKYLEPSGVLVVADDVPSDVLAAAVEAGRYAGTRLVVLLTPDGLPARSLPAGLPEDATVLAAPNGADEADQDAFNLLVGAYAAALDGGADPAAAFATATGADGWEPVAAD